MTHGLGKTFTDETIQHLQNGPFSLNVDESTNNADKRILSILVSYLSTRQERIVVEHLKSIELFKVDTASVLSAVEKLFTDNNIPWVNLVSVLMDSCAVMRGSKNGLEIRIRKEKAPQLLDIDGDSCHHVHNACKQFCGPFDGWVETLATDLHNDIKWSADLKMNLREICEMLSVPYTTPLRFLSHRWLSCYDVTASNIVMMEAFKVMYYGFMTSEDKAIYKEPIFDIVKERGVSADGKARLKELWETMEKKNMTQDGKNRKQRIAEKVIIMSQKTSLISSFYMAVLRLLKDYVLLFQKTSTLIHILHDKQEELLRNFLGLFIKPEALLNLTAIQLKNKSLDKDEGNFLHKKDMFVGLVAEEMMKKEVSSTTIKSFFEKASDAYVQCAQHLQKRLPLDNEFLRSVSAIDPSAKGHHLSARYLKCLRNTCRKFLSEEETAQISLEVHRYQVDSNLPDPSLMPIDKWWCAVRATGKYPALSKMVLTVLTCFHGPMVEGSFNLMGDIIDIKSTRMDTTTFNAIQSIKYGLKARNTTALQHFKKKDVLHTPVDRNLCVNMRSAAKMQKEEWTKAAALKTQRLQKVKTINSSSGATSSAKARDIVKERELVARQTHKTEVKRKAVQKLTELAAKRKKVSN
ncbi:hypothetical protein SNE40_001589 [Patella caerulea]|uniref:HAT C-terminal dimerisation domain-containing protein n=1 Tax=Patella caerulea TaxID=87958 RepID=A0AAN8Q8B2_PATCE